MVSPTSLSISFAAGVASHVGYFNRWEHHFYGIKYLQAFILIFAASTAKLNIYDGEPFDKALAHVFWIAACYITGLYLSLVTYRVFFSPLRNFPGPFGAKISNFWFSSQLRKHDAHKKLVALHEEHGNFVRIGSSDLSIVHPKAVQAVYGFGTKCTKADWYDLTHPMISMQTTRDRTLHDQRRRIWSAAFSDRALRSYEQRIKPYQNQLMAQLLAFGGQSVDVTKWFNLYSWDVMGDLAYSMSFHMLEKSEEHWAVKLLNEGMEPMGWMFPTWFFRVLTAIPFAARGWWKFIGFCCEKLDERMKMKVDIPDIMSALLEPWKGKNPSGSELKILQGDSQLIIVAGSDTTATTLTHLLYELVREPSQLSKLRDEILSIMTEKGEIPHVKLQYLEHLNAVISETLRLHPPVGTALQRLTPPEGMSIGSTYIPGNTTVWCPQYVIGRDEKIYKDALSFVPERWYAKPEMIKEAGAFAPFSAGGYGCIGKPLALLNIRTTIARMIMEFDISFAPGENGRALDENTTVQFTAAPGPLKIKFTPRL